jgi:hypothetical protein
MIMRIMRIFGVGRMPPATGKTNGRRPRKPGRPLHALGHIGERAQIVLARYRKRDG